MESDRDPYEPPASRRASKRSWKAASRRTASVVFAVFAAAALFTWAMTFFARHRNASIYIVLGLVDGAIALGLVLRWRAARWAGVARAVSMVVLGVAVPLFEPRFAIVGIGYAAAGIGLSLILQRRASKRTLTLGAVLLATYAVACAVVVATMSSAPSTRQRTAACSPEAYVPATVVRGTVLNYRAPIPNGWCLAREASLDPSRALEPDATLVQPESSSTIYLAGRAVSVDRPFVESDFASAICEGGDRLPARPVAGRPSRHVFGCHVRGPHRQDVVLCTAIASEHEVVVPCIQATWNDDATAALARDALRTGEELFASLELETEVRQSAASDASTDSVP